MVEWVASAPLSNCFSLPVGKLQWRVYTSSSWLSKRERERMAKEESDTTSHTSSLSLPSLPSSSSSTADMSSSSYSSSPLSYPPIPSSFNASLDFDMEENLTEKRDSVVERGREGEDGEEMDQGREGEEGEDLAQYENLFNDIFDNVDFPPKDETIQTIPWDTLSLSSPNSHTNSSFPFPSFPSPPHLSPSTKEDDEDAPESVAFLSHLAHGIPSLLRVLPNGVSDKENCTAPEPMRELWIFSFSSLLFPDSLSPLSPLSNSLACVGVGEWDLGSDLPHSHTWRFPSMRSSFFSQWKEKVSGVMEEERADGDMDILNFFFASYLNLIEWKLRPQGIFRIGDAFVGSDSSPFTFDLHSLLQPITSSSPSPAPSPSPSPSPTSTPSPSPSPSNSFPLYTRGFFLNFSRVRECAVLCITFASTLPLAPLTPYLPLVSALAKQVSLFIFLV